MRLDRAKVPVLTFCDVENDGVRMQLRRHVSIHRAGSVMFKRRRDELRRRLRRVVPSDPRLCVLLELFQRHANALPMRVSHPVITTHQRRE